MRCVVLGGGGFIGSALCDRLLQAGHEVRVFERPGVAPHRTFGAGEPLEWLAGDLLRPRDAARALRGMEVVLHLASTTWPESSYKEPERDAQSNMAAALHVMDAMRSQRVPRIVYISSGGTVYGNPKYLPIDETHPTEPLVPYGITKLAIEKHLLSGQELHGIRAVILRVANAYGEGQPLRRAHGVIGVFLERAMRDQHLELRGDGSIRRDFVHVADVAEAFLRALTYSGPDSLFNIGSGVGTSLNELLRLLERALRKPIERQFRPGRPFDVAVNILDCGHAKRELGWTPSIPLPAGIARTAIWLRTLAGQGGPSASPGAVGWQLQPLRTAAGQDDC